ncbi:hypothetical protein [Streptomyces sp. NPDC048606]|uniref:hypothetical protein n=1 Tax=Streptomyces sp. NPDC048606 TaxID=3154726 RepID=UPI00343D7A3F
MTTVRNTENAGNAENTENTEAVEAVEGLPCPDCGHGVRERPVHRTRNRWGGAPPAPRPERWWTCPACGGVGHLRPGDGAMVAMRRLDPAGGGCPFCGEEECEVATAPRPDTDGFVRDWWVCLACGTSAPRRYRP